MSCRTQEQIINFFTHCSIGDDLLMPTAPRSQEGVLVDLRILMKREVQEGSLVPPNNAVKGDEAAMRVGTSVLPHSARNCYVSLAAHGVI